ncbi:holin [Mycobacterium phage DarthPhader]|uniref:Holin n=1 Tax=Mycobacterium phage DarthPhader TaxID=1912975 RepID=A0A1I9S3V8_9CAUD|nr:holin [Mycobacterium phage DarthPhader]AOZ61252.1 holin [Mycobacterium phage DarthPhader]
MSYSPAVIAKSLMAFATATIGAAALAAHGADLSVLSLGDWLGAIGAGLVSGGAVFGTPNKSATPELAPAEVVANGVSAVIAARDAAQAEYDKVQQVVTNVASQIPALGPLATQLINQGSGQYWRP